MHEKFTSNVHTVLSLELSRELINYENLKKNIQNKSL